jgi:hypothetical protein
MNRYPIEYTLKLKKCFFGFPKVKEIQISLEKRRKYCRFDFVFIKTFSQ